jgi:hypothetical protein
MFSTLKRANTDALAAAPAKGGRGSVADPSLEQRLRNIMWAHGDAAAPRPRCVELLLEHVRGWTRQLVTTRLKPPPAAPSASAAKVEVPMGALCAIFPAEHALYERLRNARRKARAADGENEDRAVSDDEAVVEEAEGRGEGEGGEEQVSDAQQRRWCFFDARTSLMEEAGYRRFVRCREHGSLAVPLLARWVEDTLGMACTGSRGPCEARRRSCPSRGRISR